MSHASVREVILDVDMGVDDAIAVLYLATRPSVAIRAVGTVHGNVSADGAATNALTVLDLAGLGDVPVAIGARRPLVRPAQFAPEVHGDDGLGNARPTRSERRPVATSAPDQLVALARSDPGRYDLLATGPLTNLAMALVFEPELPRLVRSVTIMGGSARAIGNMTPVAEANIWHDPEAAALVFGAGWPLTMVGLDVTMRTYLDEASIAAIAAGTSAFARFAGSILPHYLDFYESISGRRACPLHDPSAAAIYADSTLVTESVCAPVRIGLGDEVRGMTIVDRRRDGGPVEDPGDAPRIVLGLDAGRFVPELVRALTE
ncbi:MAG TPA: nucleoside hydrolase [Candidatus Limnocylindrales bacterium]|nr:nucleoside hydrolase [Candidatus Limnocylindrales bacterium]